jgi:hypothetical protein
MSYLDIHTYSFYEEDRVGRPRVRFRRTKWYKKNLKKKDWSHSKPSVSPTSQSESEFLEVLKKYSLAFQDICKSFVAGYYQKEEYVAKSWAGNLLYQKIHNIAVQDLPQDLELCDVENRLRLIWYQAVVRYSQRNPSVSFENYLFRMSLFELSHWVRHIKPMTLPYCVENTYEIEDNMSELGFLFYNTEVPSFFKQILYKKYLEQITDTKVAKQLDIDRTNLRGKLRKAAKSLEHLRQA